MATAPTKAAPAAAAMAATRPFLTGTRPQEQHIYDNTKAMTTSSQQLPQYVVPTDGFLRGFYIQVTGTVPSTNSATVAFTENAPFNVLQSISFNDVSNRPIVGPMSGWELKTIIKFGGYTHSDDAQDSVSYTAVTGSGATGGNFSFILHLPVEFVQRNALGSLTNINAASTFNIGITLAASTDVYGTAPTALPNVRIVIQQESWMESNGHDPYGNPAQSNPPAVDTTQFWIRQTYTLGSGATSQQLTSFDGLVRNIIFVLQDSNGSRVQGESDFPDPLRLKYDSVIPFDRVKAIWARQIEEDFGYTGARPTTTANAAATINPGGSFRDNGVYMYPFNKDFGLKPGDEQGYGYMYVSSGTRLVFDGTIGGSGAHTLTALINYVNPAGGNALAITGGK